MNLHNKHLYRFLLIAVATIFYFFANVQRVAIPGAIFNFLQNDFSANASKITMLGAIFCYIYAFTQLFVGIIVDKIWGFKLILLGCIVFTIGNFLFPFSNGIISLYFSRALVGFGAATFYLSIIREVKKYTKDNNFSVALSYVLFIGYTGGIFANAPFVALVNSCGWRNALHYLSIITVFLCLIYIPLFFLFKPININKKKTFSLLPFKEVLQNKNNLLLYGFGAINYGLYYVLQTVLGKKFLEDFCLITCDNSALVLSLMATITAFSGTIIAFISRSMHNKRSIIFKTCAVISMLTMLFVLILLIYNVHSQIIAVLFCILAMMANISPLLILTLHCINRYEISSCAISIQNFCFFMMVGFLGMISGQLMNVFEPMRQQNVLVYTNKSYILVFSLFFILSIFELFCAFKTKDNYNI